MFRSAFPCKDITVDLKFYMLTTDMIDGHVLEEVDVDVSAVCGNAVSVNNQGGHFRADILVSRNRDDQIARRDVGSAVGLGAGTDRAVCA